MDKMNRKSRRSQNGSNITSSEVRSDIESD